MTDARTDWDRLGRYLAGESTPAERVEVERWLAANPSDARAIAALDAATRNLAPARGVDVDGALQRVRARRNAAPATGAWRVAAYTAAAAAAAAGIAFGLRSARPATSIASATRTFTTAPGVRDSIQLNDRARVVLAPGSRLVASADDASLTGEAYFVVQHDTAHPFTVRAGQVTVRDVGTRFAVQQTDDANGPVRIVVMEGSVDVTAASGTPAAHVGAGDVAMVTAAGVDVARGAASADDVAWTTGKLVFRDAALGTVVADLHRWYGVEIRVRDPALLSRHFTGTFDNQPVTRVLDVLALALGARVDRSADTAFFGNLPLSR